MLIIKAHKVSQFKKMRSDWMHFKKNRYVNHYKDAQGPGFITILQREEMLDKIFKILFYSEEEDG